MLEKGFGMICTHGLREVCVILWAHSHITLLMNVPLYPGPLYMLQEKHVMPGTSAFIIIYNDPICILYFLD